MAKCDFCKNSATHMLMDGEKVKSYLCREHASKVVSTRYVVQEIALQPQMKAVCLLCGKEKTVDEFYHYTDGRGIKRRRSECKECNLMERKMRRLKKK